MIPTAAQSTPNTPRRRYRVQAVRRWGLSRGKPLASNASYYPNGALKQFTYGNGIVHTMTQNARQLPSRSTDGSVLDLATSFDANGNVSAVTDYTASARQTKAMAYDGLDRLTSATSSMFGTATYSYDTQDNLTQASLSGGSLPRSQYYCYSANNQLEFVRNGPQCTGNASPATTALSYDVQGNLASKNGTAYSFDTGNRLRGTAGQTYRYDADGRRVRSDTAGAQLQYSDYAKDGRLLWQRDEVSGKRISNVYLAGSLLAEISRPLDSTTPTISYFHTDALGSPIAKTNAAGASIETSEYEPYGKLLNRGNDDRAGYTGHVMDSASGLTYMQQRYYDPSIGMFLSVDPVSATSAGGNFNRYWYANNNPYRFTDPDGRAPDDQNRASNASNSPCGEALNCDGHYESSDSNYSEIRLPNKRGKTHIPMWCDGGADCSELRMQNQAASGEISQEQLKQMYEARAAGAVGGLVLVVGGYAVYSVATAGGAETIVVARWGRPGLEAGDWVMKGGANWWNYLRSFKWQPGMGNQFARFGTGAEYIVPRGSLISPRGWGVDGWVKCLFGQCRYFPPVE